MGLKDIYLSLEEKWYRALDKIDSKIPIYGIIDKIDSVIPSFILFLIIILFIILFLGFNLYLNFEPYNTTIKLTDNSGNAVYDSVFFVKVMDNGNIVYESRERTNDAGEVTLNGLAYGQEIFVDVNLSKGTYNDSFFITEKEQYEIITLKQKIDLKPVKKYIYLQENFVAVTSPVEMNFFCENSSVIPTPTSAVSINATIEVTEPVNCITLYGKVISDKYENKQYIINSTSYPLKLEKKEAPKVSLKIKITENDLPTDSSFNIRITGENTYTRLSSKTIEEFEVEKGEYFISISDPSKNYGSVTRTVIINENKQEDFAVSKTVKARFNIHIMDNSNNQNIENAIVSIKNSQKKLIENGKTDETGRVTFAVTETDTFYITAKKVGDVGEGYFSKEIEVGNPSLDNNIILKLDKITTANAGEVTVVVTDQDDEAISNARIVLKYEKDDTLVELNEVNNYVFSDINGSATFLAGMVEGKVYAYATKNPFKGESTSKLISIEGDNLFNVKMQVGNTNIRINVTDETNENVTGEARLYFINEDSTGLISIEDGVASTITKSGKTAFLVVTSPEHESYYSEPRFLWPNTTETFNVVLKKEITEPSIILKGIYNENKNSISTMQSGKKYYALLEVEADNEYDSLIHFRAGKEELLVNDFIEIYTVEAAQYFTETRGTSYSPERGYEFDSENLTDSLAKWTTMKFDNLTKGTHLIKINFRLKEDTPSNKELQFFWRASFDDEKKPSSTASEELYDETYASNIYFEGEEASCTENFCIMSEWLYDKMDDLYINSPFTIRQQKEYTYHYQIINNSNTDFGEDAKRIALSIDNIGEYGAKIISYSIKSPKGETTGGAIKSIKDLEIKSFEKNEAIDITLTIVGNATGNSIIRTQLKSEGIYVFNDEENFSVPSEQKLFVTIDKDFIPALIDTPIVVSVTDSDNEPINEARVNVYVKEAGFNEYLSYEETTNRLGKATVYSGAHFPNTKIIIEIAKQEFELLRLVLSVSDNVVAFNPSSLNLQLNTITQRDVTSKVEVANISGRELEIYSVKINADFQGAINESAMNSYFTGLRGKIIETEYPTDIDIMRVRLSNDLTSDSMLEPVNISGTMILTLKAKNTSIVFDKLIPITINITSGANVSASCLIINRPVQSGVTEKGQITFNFDILNACESESNGVPISIDGLTASSNNEINGAVQLSIQSYTTGNSGRSALDSLARNVYGKVNGGEKLLGTVIYTPNTDAVGQTINIPIEIQGQFQGQTITTDPSQIKFTVDVLNLKECIKIDSESSPVSFDESTTMSVDATACLGQNIDVWLCRNDAGCSGGTGEGKISLSKNMFSLNNSSEIIDVYSSDLPGSYGITVWARIKGKSSWSYIGEVPVAFRESEGKYFELSKFEANLIGDGMQDTFLLTNKMLDQQVRVKATDCVWGAQEPEINWMQVLGGAVLGAGIGNMIGSGFTREVKQEENNSEFINKNSQEIESKVSGLNDGEKGYLYLNKQTGEVQFSATPLSQTADLTYKGTITASQSLNGEGMIYSYAGLGSNNSFATIASVSKHAVTEITTSSTIVSGLWGFFNNAPNAPNQTKTASPLTTPQANKSVDAIAQQLGDAVFTNDNWNPGFTNAGSATGPIDVDFQHLTINGDTVTLLQTANGKGIYYRNTFYPVDATTNYTQIAQAIHNNTTGFSGFINNTFGTSGLDAGANVFPYSTTNSSSTDSEIFKPINENTLPKISFGSFDLDKDSFTKNIVNDLPKISFASTYAGWGSAIGAIVGALASWYQQSQYDCGDNSQVATYRDFVIFLAGDEEGISVTSPNGEISETRKIPSDAGALSMTLDGVSASWNFTNADYSTEEHVGINLTNTGINDAQAKYGILTINARTHKHGSAILIPDGTTSSTSDIEYDVICNEPTFGKYWIGSGEEEGLCTGISEGSYSQKYHIRVISGEPTSEDAKIVKSSACYNGVLTGATGPEAVPRVRLDWQWNNIEPDMCDYGNSNYVYCDGVQFTAVLVKKIAALQEFFNLNPSTTCPIDPVLDNVMGEFEEINSLTELVADGRIGVEDAIISIDTDTDEATATVTINNKTDAPLETYISAIWKGQEEPVNTLIQDTFPVGKKEITFNAQLPKWEDVYFFSATANGPSGNRRTITRAFINLPPNTGCWAQPTTRSIGGMPSVFYYLSDESELTWTSRIPDSATLHSYLNFGTYLMRENYPLDLFKDTHDYYINQAFQIVDDTEKQVLTKLKTNNFSLIKRFSNQQSIEAGLYDVKLNIDFYGDEFNILNNDSKIETSLLLIRSPSQDNPFYKMPFDGEVGTTQRNNYGVVYTNQSDTDLKITDTLSSKYNSTSNGVVNLNTNYEDNFEKINSSVGTRGQIAILAHYGATADLTYSPSYATPVIGRYNLSGTSGKFTYNINRSQSPVITGGNLSYWTGAARSYDFYGASASEMYKNTPDSLIDETEYGFRWTDASHNATLYLKSFFYTPVNNDYVIVTENGSFWTSNNNFSGYVGLNGISGMKYNSDGDYFENLEDLFDMVRNSLVCVSNDGSTINFWWNPKVIENTAGSNDSLAKKELTLIGG